MWTPLLRNDASTQERYGYWGGVQVGFFYGLCFMAMLDLIVLTMIFLLAS